MSDKFSDFFTQDKDPFFDEEPFSKNRLDNLFDPNATEDGPGTKKFVTSDDPVMLASEKRFGELTELDEQKWLLFRGMLRNTNVKVVFLKVNGQERTMICTLREEAYKDHEFASKGNPDQQDNPTLQPVWDLEKNAWRSVKKGTIISVEEHKLE